MRKITKILTEVIILSSLATSVTTTYAAELTDISNRWIYDIW